MTGSGLDLASDFPEATYEQWRALAEKALKGAPFDKVLVKGTYEGITVQPVYTADAAPEATIRAMRRQSGSWEIRQRHDHPEPGKANAGIRIDLESGVDSVSLCLDPDGDGGSLVRTVDDLDKVLDGVDLANVPVSLASGRAQPAYAALLLALYARRGVDMGSARISLGLDPIGALATTGSLPEGLDAALANLADCIALARSAAPNAIVARLGVAPYHDAGADEVQSLAAMLATGAAYLRAAAEREDIAPAESARFLEIGMSVDGDLFLTIAKMRAARILWARLLEACSVPEDDRAVTIHATTAMRIMSRRDPYVNVLRTTATTFGAALGGADGITSLPLDAALGVSTDFSRRVARNVQIVLREESALGRVIDPTGGSWYVERLTADLAEKAWAGFQDIESKGGMAAVLRNGSFAEQIAATRADRQKKLARRRDPITGVSEFPNVHEEPVETDAFDLAVLRAAATSGGSPVSLAAAGGGARAASLSAAAAGATVATLMDALGSDATTSDPLPTYRLSQDFEALRDASDAWLSKNGRRPLVFLANLGRVAQHTARATFAKNYFEAGGMETIPNEGYSDPDALAAAFKESGATVACLCGSDDLYEEMVETMGPALKQAGCSFLFLAGRPGGRADKDAAAGVDGHIALGDDLLAALTSTLKTMGVID